MSRQIEFRISGEPVAQGRPRFSRRGNFVKTYDPKKSRDAKQTVKYFATEAMKGENMVPLEGPLSMRVEFGVALPKSDYRKRTPREKAWRTKKPDLDNLVKTVKDACSGVVYLDDNQIVDLKARKLTCAQGEAPYTRVLFKELPDYGA